MFEKYRNRYLVFMIVAAVMFVVLVVQLFVLTVVNGESYSAQAQTKKTRVISLTGNRGTIYDVNGTPLAYDEVSYNIEFYKDPTRSASSDRAYYTEIILKTIDLIESNGGSVIETFNIHKNENGEFYFEFGITNEENIKKRETNWRKNMYVGEESTAEEIYYQLRERYRIPEEMTYEECFKLLSVWQEVQLATWKSYIPVTIAKNVDLNTVIELEARSSELEGMQVSESSSRVYPRNSLAAHSIGYLGKITDNETLQKYLDKGYDTDDLIGVMGVEATMEEYLTAESSDKQGQKVIEIDTSGQILDVISYAAPQDGYDVTLTLDANLQAELEKALESNVKRTYEKQLRRYAANKSKYDAVLKGREPNLAISGAAVVMNPKTGDVLAIASYPSFDLNLFTGGIDDETYKLLVEDKASPLFNKAISSKIIPGSVFKMVTGIAGLMEGEISLGTRISDKGPFDKYIKSGSGAKAPSCWTSNYSAHSNQTIVSALKNSCNYFFYEVADRIGIEKLNEWADKFGLTSKTGIQLTSEATGQVGNQQTLYDNTKSISEQKSAVPRLVYNAIVSDIKGFGQTLGVEYTDEEVKSAADRIIVLAGSGIEQKGPQIREILEEELDIHPSTASRNSWDLQLSSRLTELEWTGTATAITGTGQQYTAITPIGLARYICSIVNGGKVMQANIIDKVTDQNGNVIMETEPVVVEDLQIPESYINSVKEGMREVVSGEDRMSVATAFQNMPAEYAKQIGGKTGTGQVTTNLEIENNGTFVAFAPYDDPEIVVVVMIPNGYAGADSMYAAADILEYWFDQKSVTK